MNNEPSTPVGAIAAWSAVLISLTVAVTLAVGQLPGATTAFIVSAQTLGVALLSTAAYRVARRFGEFTDEGNSLSDKPYRLWKISVAALSLPWLITVITFVSTITLHTSGSHVAAANVLWIALVAFLLAVTATSSAMSGDYNGRLFERRRKLKLSEAK